MVCKPNVVCEEAVPSVTEVVPREIHGRALALPQRHLDRVVLAQLHEVVLVAQRVPPKQQCEGICFDPHCSRHLAVHILYRVFPHALIDFESVLLPTVQHVQLHCCVSLCGVVDVL